MITKIIAVFFMSMAVGILYRIPRALLMFASFVGALGWLAMAGVMNLKGNVVFANFIGGLVVGLASEILARALRKPASIFSIPGFIPLVPGREAYTTMYYMVEGTYSQGVSWGMQALLIGGAIAFGMFVSKTIYWLILNYVTMRRQKFDAVSR